MLVNASEFNFILIGHTPYNIGCTRTNKREANRLHQLLSHWADRLSELTSWSINTSTTRQTCRFRKRARSHGMNDWKKKTSLPHQYITIPRFISAACTQFKSVVHVHVTQFRTQGTNYNMLHKSQYMYEHDVSQNQTLVPQLHVWCRAIFFNWKLHKGKTVYTLITLQVFLHYMYNDRTLWLQLAATLTSGIAAWQHVTWRIASLLVSNMISVIPVTSPRHVIVSSNTYMYILHVQA